MTTTLSITGPGEFGLRSLYARHGDGPLLVIGFCSEIEHEYRAPDGPRWSSVLWDIAAFPGQVPRDGHAGPARRTAEEILATLQARVTERGAWWLEEHDTGDGGLQWGAMGPRGASWQVAWQPGRLAERNVRAWRDSSGRTGHLGHATTKTEARAEAVRIAGLIAAGKTRG